MPARRKVCGIQQRLDPLSEYVEHAQRNLLRDIKIKRNRCGWIERVRVVLVQRESGGYACGCVLNSGRHLEYVTAKRHDHNVVLQRDERRRQGVDRRLLPPDQLLQ